MKTWITPKSENRFASMRFGRLVDTRLAGDSAIPIRLGFNSSRRLIDELVRRGDELADEIYSAGVKGVGGDCNVSLELDTSLKDVLVFSDARRSLSDDYAIDLADRSICVDGTVLLTRVTFTFCPTEAGGQVYKTMDEAGDRLFAKLWFRAIPIGRLTAGNELLQLGEDEVVAAMSMVRGKARDLLDVVADRYAALISEYIGAAVDLQGRGDISLFVLDAEEPSFDTFAAMIERASSKSEVELCEHDQVAGAFNRLLSGILSKPVLNSNLAEAFKTLSADGKVNVVDLVESRDRSGELSLHFALYGADAAEFFGVARARPMVEIKSPRPGDFNQSEKLAPTRSPANKASAIVSNDLVMHL
ncbi:hypothetical protein [Hyphomonas sp.]|uniref:hypothetical protein n=1 Tax=Hyphomonas sp. TaxID=87 RepID=UPI0025C4310A|nr:hypothetical protein [Hyphomonas sp.]